MRWLLASAGWTSQMSRGTPRSLAVFTRWKIARCRLRIVLVSR